MAKKRFMAEVQRTGFNIDKERRNEIQFLRSEKDGSKSSLMYYSILPGIDIIYNNLRSDQGSEVQYQAEEKKIIELNYCLQGSFACTLAGGDFSLKEGEIEAHLWGIPKENPHLLQQEYIGVSLLISPDKATLQLAAMFPEFNIHLANLLEGINQHNGVVRIKATPEITRIFHDIYKINPGLQQYLLQLKVLEILGLIQTMPVFGQEIKSYYRYQDMDKVKAIHQKIMTELDRHYPLDNLAEEFGIGKTNLQKCFREIYGKSYYAYIKQQRMRKALNYLEEGKLSVVEIAGKLGYGNPSKFAAAFRSVYGVSPRDFKGRNL